MTKHNNEDFEVRAIYRDGGSVQLYWNGQSYIIDRRMQSQTKGRVYKGDINGIMEMVDESIERKILQLYHECQK